METLLISGRTLFFRCGATHSNASAQTAILMMTWKSMLLLMAARTRMLKSMNSSTKAITDAATISRDDQASADLILATVLVFSVLPVDRRFAISSSLTGFANVLAGDPGQTSVLEPSGYQLD